MNNAEQGEPLPDQVELLPCPFCGSRTPQTREDDDAFYVDCYRKGCGVTVSIVEDAPTALRIWNTRHPQRSEGDYRESLEEMVAAFDTRPAGEPSSITKVTHECALSLAKQTLGWPQPSLW